jgi:hypothetical protein
MNNKEQARKFLEDNKETIETMVENLLEKVNYNIEEKVHFVNENNEVFTSKMLEVEISEIFSDYLEIPYRQRWIITNKIYFMLLPDEERTARLKDHRKKLNKTRVKKINKRRKTQKKKKNSKKEIA